MEERYGKTRGLVSRRMDRRPKPTLGPLYGRSSVGSFRDLRQRRAPARSPRIAIVHDWLVTYAGAEHVLEQLLNLYPHADLYCVCDALPAADRAFLNGQQPQTSFIQNLPGFRTHYRYYLPLMPLAVEQFDLSAYDLIISSSHAVAKGVLTGPDQLHISYVHSPIRYAWDLQHQYLKESGLEDRLAGWMARWWLHRMRLWDTRTANGVDHFVANSAFIARRIQKTYRREATVIYPPVDLDRFKPGGGKDDYYVTASRLVPYKKLHLVIEAFKGMPNRHLKVVGDGPDRDKLQAMVDGAPNIEWLGYLAQERLVEVLGKARAFVFAAEEDFGILPVEAMACGTPVIAYGYGGVSETVQGLDGPHPTGCFFEEQTSEAVIRAVALFEQYATRITAEDCRKQAERFSVRQFRDRLSTLVDRRWEEFDRQVYHPMASESRLLSCSINP